jgi:hypothetical protein
MGVLQAAVLATGWDEHQATTDAINTGAAPAGARARALRGRRAGVAT